MWILQYGVCRVLYKVAMLDSTQGLQVSPKLERGQAHVSGAYHQADFASGNTTNLPLSHPGRSRPQADDHRTGFAEKAT